MTQTTINPLSELEDLLKEKKRLQYLIDHYRTEYKKIRIAVKDNKHKLKEVMLKINQITKQGGHENGNKIDA